MSRLAKNPAKIINLGTFRVESDTLRISDPCYKKDTWCAGTIPNVSPGLWEARVVYSSGGQACSKLQAKLCQKVGDWHFPHNSGIEVGVDSGQAGIFDEKYYGAANTDEEFQYRNKNGFYFKCCHATENAHNAAVIDNGVVSCAGHGDGTYEAYYSTDTEGKVTGVEIDYGLGPETDGLSSNFW